VELRKEITSPIVPAEAPALDNCDRQVPYKGPAAFMARQWRANAEFQQLTVDAWCTPKKVRVSNLANQLSGLEG
jgi:hypothetical protein